MDFKSLAFDSEAKTSEIVAVIFLLILGFSTVLVTGSVSGIFATGDAAFFIIGGYFLMGLIAYGGFVTWRELRLIRNTPTSKIRSMPMGTVEVKGTAEQGPEGIILKSPFSGKECLFYRYEIEEYVSSGKNSHWETVSKGFDGVRFVLDDGTGEVIVDPENADVEMPKDNSIRINSADNETDQIREFMNQKGIRGTGGLLFDNDRRYHEWYVTPGEDVYVFGYASNERDDHGEYPIIKDDERAEMFMISDRSEKELVSKKKWKSGLAMFGGALGCLGIYALMLYLGGAL